MPSRPLLPAAVAHHSLIYTLRTLLLGAVLAVPALSAQACDAADGSGKPCKTAAAIAPIDADGHPGSFCLIANDNRNKGVADSFTIGLSTGYSQSGALIQGTIRISSEESKASD